MPETTVPFLKISALIAASALTLTGCGGGDGDTTDGKTPETLPTPSSTVEVPDDAAITAPGTQLAFGDKASVTFETKKAGTVLDLTVLSAEQGDLKDFSGFNLDDPYRKNANYFYVRVDVANSGTETVGGVDVPLWGISGENTLLPIVKFTSTFKKCPTETLPKNFAPGDDFKTCLVYLSPDKGSLEGVSYRPTDNFVPIEWRGEVKVPGSKGDKKNDKKPDSKN